MDILHEVILLPIGLILLVLVGLSSAVQQPTVSGVPNANGRLSGYLSIDERSSTQAGEFLFNVTLTFYGDPGTVKPTGSIAPQYVTVSTSDTGHTRVYTVTNIDALDRDSGTGGRPSMKLDFLVTDQTGNQVNFHVILYLNDINDNSPIFKDEPYTWNIEEKGFINGTSFTKIKATDYDNGANGHAVYSMTPVTQSDELKMKYSETFKINDSTGDVTLRKELDYESNTYYQFAVVAQDKGSPPRSTTSNLIIRVIDVQDMPPFFTGNLYHTTIQENVPMGSSVITVNARDGDTGVCNDVNYTISGGNGCEMLFNISSHGEITTDVPIDSDSGIIKGNMGECKLEITANEIAKSGQRNYGETNATTVVTIIVFDEDDNSPVLSSASYLGTLHENPTKGTRVDFTVPIIVSDKDQGDNAKLRIIVRFADGTICDEFEPIPATVSGIGTINIAVNGNASKTLFDYEQNKEINLQITVEEVINSSRRHSAYINITLLNVNDNYPVFSQPNYVFNLKEDSKNWTAVGNIMAIYLDSTAEKNETLKFSISGGMNKFAIDPVSGIIYTNCKRMDLDRERIDEYHLRVTVNDEDFSNSATLIIHLLDVNDNSPIFAQDSYPVYMEENDNKYNATYPFVNVMARDIDQANTDNSKISYYLIKSTQPNFLENVTIDNSTGSIWLDTPIDFERLTTPGTDQKLIELVVQATDAGNPRRTGNSIVKIFVRDANDNSPIFTEEMYSGTVKENETSTIDHYTSIGYVGATDADGTERNSRVNYFILSGASHIFTINISTGEVKIQLNAHLDRDVVSSYNLSIVAIDQGSPSKSGSTSMVVTVTDAKECGGLAKCTTRLTLPPIPSDQTTVSPSPTTWHSSISFLKSSMSTTSPRPTPTSSAKQTIKLTTYNSPMTAQKTHMETQLKSTTTTQKIPTLDNSIITSCTSSGWNITIDIGLLKELYPDLIVTNIYFGTNACRGVVDGNYLIFRPGLRECLTSERISNGALIYANDLYYAVYDPVHPFIIRQHVWTYSIECDVIRNEATSSHVHHDVEYHNASTTGHYGISMAFYKDPNFLQHVSGNPLHVSVGDSVYVKVFTPMTDWTVKMKLHTCYTKPYSDAVDDKKYYLIQNGCEVDANTHIMSQSTHESTFVFQDFEYDSYHEGLDINCNATFCKTTDYSPQCLQACNANPLLVG